MAERASYAAIPRTPESPAFDARGLVERAMARVRQLARIGWTDHNVHDPGITILEAACLALTENAYRSRWSMADLLADTHGSVAAQFFRCRDVLPNAPLTGDDWRRLLIDLPGIRNAWVEEDPDEILYVDLEARELARDPPAHGHYRRFRLQGLQRVRVDYAADCDTDEKRARVLDDVRDALERNRNLCQAFTGVTAVDEAFYALCGEIELDGEASSTDVAAGLLLALERELSPPIPRRSLAQMLVRRDADGSPLAIDRIFEGPLPHRGFVADEDLAASVLPAEIRLSDLIARAMDVPGVKHVVDLQLRSLDEQGESQPVANAWRIPVPHGRRPRLSDRRGRLVFTRNGLPVSAWAMSDMPTAVRSLVDAGRLQDIASMTHDSERDPVPVPTGRVRDSRAYIPLRNDLPAIYGVGADGPPLRADARRRAQILQLQAFLLFFDAVLAGQRQTLAHARRWLSVAHADLAAGNAVGQGAAAEALAMLRGLDTATGTLLLSPQADPQMPGVPDADALRRRHRFLDHLLARIGEDFAPYSAAMELAFPDERVRLAADKSRFLSQAASLGAQRAQAWYRAPGDDEHALPPLSQRASGLETRIRHLLGIDGRSAPDPGPGAVDVEIYFENDDTPGDEPRFRVRHPVTGKILLSASTRYVGEDDARAELGVALQCARAADGYQRLTTIDGRHYFNVVAAGGIVVARRIEYFATADAMEAAIADTIACLRGEQDTERLYVIEHLSLRPTRPDDPLWAPLCLDPGCDDCSDDPYSHRLHIVLPADAGRFRDMDFRRFVETTIRQEVPAHLLPTVCWLGARDMHALETAYRDWADLPRDAEATRRSAALRALIAALASGGNSYPQHPLTDCMGGDDPTPHFILGRTALGDAGTDGPGPD